MRPSALTLLLTNLGAGEVIRDIPPEDLLPAGEPRVPAPRTAYATNLRFADGYVRTRNGYRALATHVSSLAVNGMYTAVFDDGTTEVLRADPSGVYRLSTTAGVESWTLISSAIGLLGTPRDTWAFASVRRSGSVSPTNQIFLSNGSDLDAMYKYIGSGTTISTVGIATFKGPLAIVGHRGRALAMNVYDVAATARKTQRVYRSIVGDPTDFTTTGSGSTDLDDDPYPIKAATVIGGNVCVFKGDATRGSIVVGTQTGVTNNPYRWDTLSTGGTGILYPRTLVAVDPSLVFFVGHDGFYLYDGARGLLRVNEGNTKSLFASMNQYATYAAFAWYKPRTHEVYVAMPTGVNTYGNEVWCIDIRERRAYGPLTYTDRLNAATPYIAGGSLVIDALVGTIDSLTGTIDSLGMSTQATGVAFGDTVGKTWLDDELTATDGGTSVTGTYRTPPIRGESYAAGKRPLSGDSSLCLRDVTLAWSNVAAWTPTVRVSVDGATTWTTISDGVAIGGGTDTGRIKNTTYSAPELAGTWFQVEVSGGSNMRLSALKMEFTYAGSSRNL